LLPELADQRAFGRVDPQRDLRLVLGQGLEGRQVRESEGEHETRDEQAGDSEAGQNGQRNGQKTKPHQGIWTLCRVLLRKRGRTSEMIPRGPRGKLTRHLGGLLLGFNANSTYRA